jgi:hypothetical protein
MLGTDLNSLTKEREKQPSQTITFQILNSNNNHLFNLKTPMKVFNTTNNTHGMRSPNTRKTLENSTS